MRIDVINLEIFLGNDENRYEYILFITWIYLLHCLRIYVVKALNTLDLKDLLMNLGSICIKQTN
jgi:hypothetical protein